MKKGKRLYNIGGNAVEEFYPSNKSYTSMIDNKPTPVNIQKAKEKALEEKLQIEAQNKKLYDKFGPNAVPNRTNRRRIK